MGHCSVGYPGSLESEKPYSWGWRTRGILHSCYLQCSQLLAIENTQLCFNWGFNLERFSLHEISVERDLLCHLPLEISFWSYMSQVILAEQFGYQLQGYLGDLSDFKILKCDNYTASTVAKSSGLVRQKLWVMKAEAVGQWAACAHLQPIKGSATAELGCSTGAPSLSVRHTSQKLFILFRCINLVLMWHRLFHKLFSKGFWQWFRITRLLFISPVAFFRPYPPIPYNY